MRHELPECPGERDRAKRRRPSPPILERELAVSCLDLNVKLDFQLTDEQRLISETAREFADKEIAPRVRENDRAGRFDRELALDARRDGLPRRPGRRRSTAAAGSTT